MLFQIKTDEGQKMKSQKMLLILLALIVSCATSSQQTNAQTATSGKIYQQMTPAER
jgi:hypothetical protein